MKTLDIDIQLYNDDFNCYEFIKNSVTDFLNFSKMPITDPKEKCLNVPISYDIETTRFIDRNRPDDDQQVVIPYSWQIGIYNHCLIGRYIEDINQFMTALKNYLDDYKIKFCKIYIHNLAFEFFHTWRVFENLDKKFISVDNRTPIEFTLYNKSIRFNDSYQLSNLSLDKTAKGFKRQILKKKPIDYTIIRLPETPLTEDELLYNAFDVYCVNEYIFELLENNTDTPYIIDIPMTSTGFVRNKIKNSVGVYIKYDDRTPDQQDYYNVLKKCNIVKYGMLEILRKTFSGGFTHSGFFTVGKVHENVSHFDFTSSYPTVLLTEKYPVSSFYNAFEKEKTDVKATYYTKGFFNVGTDDTVIKNVLFNSSIKKLRDMNIGFLCCVTFKGVKLKDNVNDMIISISSDDISISGQHDRKNSHIYNGRVKECDLITLWLTDVDFYEIKKFYNIKEKNLKTCLIARFEYLPFIFRKTILNFYKQKTVLKDTDNEFEYQYNKALLNSIYGMCVTDPIRPDFEIENNQIEKHLLTEDEEKQKVIKQNDCTNKQFIYYPWGVWCTAYARRNLFSAILECGDDYLYADTDSVFIKNFDKHRSYFEKYDKSIKDKMTKSLKYEYSFATSDLLMKLTEMQKEIESIKDDCIKEKYIKNIKDLKTRIDRLKNQSQELEDIYNSCKNIKGEFKPLGVWSQEKFCKKFCTIGAKRYIEQFENGELKFTIAGIKKDYIKKFFENSFNGDADKILTTFSNLMWGTIDSINVPTEYSGKVTNTYIDHIQKGDMSNVYDIKGNKYNGINYQYMGYGGFYFDPTTFELTIFPDFDYFRKQIILSQFNNDKLGK